ncbi:2-oxo acid dehydrogenase subunit E2 [Streptomyces sp. NPDC055060]
MGEFTMPALGADMAEGTLTQWLVSPGDTVDKGDPVAVIETAKSDIEVECFESGTVARLLAEPGDVLPVGAPLAVISGAGEQLPEDAGPAAEEPAPLARAAADALSTAARPHTPDGAPRPEAGPLVRHLAAERGIDLAAVRGTGTGGRITRADVERGECVTSRKAAPKAGPRMTSPGARIRATPYARRLAAQLGVDLATVTGSGENGAVRAADVRETVRGEAAPDAAGTASVPPVPAEDRSTDGTRPSGAAVETAVDGAVPETGSADNRRSAAMRRAVADLMSRSKREIPHYYLATTIDMSSAAAWLRTHNRGRPVAEHLVPAALLLKAAAVAARQVPELNGHWGEDGLEPCDHVHLAVAVSLRGGGLLTPVLHEAESLPVAELMGELKDVVQRARRGRLRGRDISGATLTVTSLGDQGVDSVFGVIHPPQVALVGFGSVVERPWAAAGMLGVRPLVTATLSADHRATDGAVGARYLNVVSRLLQAPEEL